MSVVLMLEPYGDGHSLEQEVLGPLGAEVQLVSSDAAVRARQLQGAVGLLVVDHRVDAGLLGSAPRCRVVATYGIGVDNIDLDAARRAGVVVANVPDYCQDEVAEHALGLWLACERRIARGDAMVRAGGWDGPLLAPIRRLRGLTFGLLGFGRIARQVAVRVRGFGVSVIAYDPAISDTGDDFDFVELKPDLAAVLEAADVVSLHIPLSCDTEGLIDAQAMSWMKPGAVLINTARGGLVDEAALIDALKAGRIAGAGLDVLVREPPDAAFEGRDLESLVLTPHIAFLSSEAVAAAKRGAAEAISQVLQEQPVRGRVA
jgi:D-3-phosphoglycerate dehydrogenase